MPSGCDGDGSHWTGGALEAVDEVARVRLPQGERMVLTPCHHKLAVRCEGDCRYFAVVACEGADLFPRRQVPEVDAAAPTPGRGDPFTVGREGDGVDEAVIRCGKRSQFAGPWQRPTSRKVSGTEWCPESSVLASGEKARAPTP